MENLFLNAQQLKMCVGVLYWKKYYYFFKNYYY